MFENYYSAVKFLESLTNVSQLDYMRARHKEGKKFLRRMEELVQALGLDLKQFKVVHITGTAGKGTSVTMTHNILRAAGKRVGSYYSPHATTSIERIKANDKLIAPDDWVKILEELKPVIERLYLKGKYGRPSYFEISLAMALKYFEKMKCEYVVLETGCGGEFDATNVIRRPLITAITNIGYDHTQILGKTLTKIARAKAGIIKKGSIFLTTEKRPRLLKIFRRICAKKRASYREIREIGEFNPNKLLARAIGRELGIGQEKIERGIAQTALPCRFEIAQKRPLVILDGSHNEDKIRYLIEQLKNIRYNDLYLIFTLKADKNAARIVRQFKNTRLKQVYLTRHLIGAVACSDLKNLYNLFLRVLGNKKNAALIRFDPYQALDEAIKKARPNDLILVSGSFYLAGELRKKWVSEDKILQLNS